MTDTEMNHDQQAALMAANYAGLQKTMNAAGWTNHQEDLMAAFGEKAAGLRWLHNKASGGWKCISDRLTSTGIVLTALSSAAGFASTSLEGDGQTAMLYVVSAVGLAASLIQSFKKFYNAEEKAAEHGAIAKQFGTFYRMMVMEMGQGREDRASIDELRAHVTKEFDRMQQDAPPIGGGVVAAWKAAFPNVENEPDVCEDEFIIKIEGRGDLAGPDIPDPITTPVAKEEDEV